MNLPLTLALAVAIVGYTIYLLIRMRSNRGGSCGSCSGCPYAGKCNTNRRHS